MFGTNNHIGILAIGDVTTDAFIKLKDAHIESKLNSDRSELCIKYGEKIPYEEVTVIPGVGNSANISVCATRLGVQSALLSCIGNDENGEMCLKSLKENGVNTKYIKTEREKLTNYHYVLCFGPDHTILVKHNEFEYNLPNIENVSWIYLSSLPSNSLSFHEEIVEYLKNHPETKLAFQPGTFQIKFGVEKLKDIYKNTEIFFSNIQEAEDILNIQTKDILTLAKSIEKLGPKIVVISDNSNGAYMYQNEELWHIPTYVNITPPIDSTGAGDAFSGTFISALILGKTPIEALSWGPINAMSVVEYLGSQKGLLGREKIEEYLKNSPEGYKPTKIN